MEGKKRLFGFMIISVAFGLMSQTGCSFLLHAIHAVKGNKMEAECNDLLEKRVAIVCVSGATAYGPDTSSEMITGAVRNKLLQEKLKLDLVRQSEIDNWLDSNWEDIDYVEIGKAVNADVVLAIDMQNYSIHEGTTLYKGRATYTVSVFDMQNGGRVSFSRGPNDFEFPPNHGTPATSVSERQFQQFFVHELASDIAKYFYDYDIPDTVARSPAHIGN